MEREPLHKLYATTDLPRDLLSFGKVPDKFAWLVSVVWPGQGGVAFLSGTLHQPPSGSDAWAVLEEEVWPGLTRLTPVDRLRVLLFQKTTPFGHVEVSVRWWERSGSESSRGGEEEAAGRVFEIRGMNRDLVQYVYTRSSVLLSNSLLESMGPFVGTRLVLKGKWNRKIGKIDPGWEERKVIGAKRGRIGPKGTWILDGAYTFFLSNPAGALDPGPGEKERPDVVIYRHANFFRDRVAGELRAEKTDWMASEDVFVSIAPTPTEAAKTRGRSSFRALISMEGARGSTALNSWLEGGSPQALTMLPDAGESEVPGDPSVMSPIDLRYVPVQAKARSLRRGQGPETERAPFLEPTAESLAVERLKLPRKRARDSLALYERTGNRTELLGDYDVLLRQKEELDVKELDSNDVDTEIFEIEEGIQERFLNKTPDKMIDGYVEAGDVATLNLALVAWQTYVEKFEQLDVLSSEENRLLVTSEANIRDIKAKAKKIKEQLEGRGGEGNGEVGHGEVGHGEVGHGEVGHGEVGHGGFETSQPQPPPPPSFAPSFFDAGIAAEAERLDARLEVSKYANFALAEGKGNRNGKPVSPRAIPSGPIASTRDSLILFQAFHRKFHPASSFPRDPLEVDGLVPLRLARLSLEEPTDVLNLQRESDEALDAYVARKKGAIERNALLRRARGDYNWVEGVSFARGKFSRRATEALGYYGQAVEELGWTSQRTERAFRAEPKEMSFGGEEMKRAKVLLDRLYSMRRASLAAKIYDEAEEVVDDSQPKILSPLGGDPDEDPGPDPGSFEPLPPVEMSSPEKASASFLSDGYLEVFEVGQDKAPEGEWIPGAPLGALVFFLKEGNRVLEKAEAETVPPPRPGKLRGETAPVLDLIVDWFFWSPWSARKAFISVLKAYLRVSYDAWAEDASALAENLWDDPDARVHAAFVSRGHALSEVLEGHDVEYERIASFALVKISEVARDLEDEADRIQSLEDVPGEDREKAFEAATEAATKMHEFRGNVERAAEGTFVAEGEVVAKPVERVTLEIAGDLDRTAIEKVVRDLESAGDELNEMLERIAPVSPERGKPIPYGKPWTVTWTDQWSKKAADAASQRYEANARVLADAMKRRVKPGRRLP